MDSALRYVETMPDSQVRCLLYAFARHFKKIEGWQSIESVPRDGTVILLFDPDHANEGDSGQFIGKYDDGWFDEHYNWTLDPTHWVPLHDPPEISREKQND